MKQQQKVYLTGITRGENNKTTYNFVNKQRANEAETVLRTFYKKVFRVSSEQIIVISTSRIPKINFSLLK